MKRFAAHYLFLPNAGFIKHCGIELSATGGVKRIFPLAEEVESVEWHPGVIVLISRKDAEYMKINNAMFEKNIALFITNHPNAFKKLWDDCEDKLNEISNSLSAVKNDIDTLIPYLLYPFDFTSMQLVAETRHKQLQ